MGCDVSFSREGHHCHHPIFQGFLCLVMKEKRDFKGVWIPRDIWLDKSLNPIEKVLLVEIDSLDNDPKRGCFASNEYLAKFIQRKASSTANMISKLRKRGYIETVFWDGRNRGLRVKVKQPSLQDESSLHKKVKADFTKKVKQPSQKSEHNNTVNNTGINSVSSGKKNKGEILPLNAEKNEPPKVAANPPQSYEQQHKELMETIMKEITPSAQKAYLDSVGHRMTTKEFTGMVAEMVDHYFEDYGFKKNPQGFIKRKLRTFISNRKTKAARKKPKSNALARGEYRNPPRVEEMNRMKKSRQIL